MVGEKLLLCRQALVHMNNDIKRMVPEVLFGMGSSYMVYLHNDINMVFTVVSDGWIVTINEV